MQQLCGCLPWGAPIMLLHWQTHRRSCSSYSCGFNLGILPDPFFRFPRVHKTHTLSQSPFPSPMPLNNPVMDFDELFRKELLMRSLTFAKWPVTCCGSQPVSEWVLVCLSSVPSCLPSLPGGHHSGICFFLPWNMLKAREHENTRKRGRFYASERIIGSDWLKQSKAKLSWFLPRMLLKL